MNQAAHLKSLHDDDASELRSVVRMSVPLVITTSTRMVMDVTDYVLIRWVGSDAQAALLPAELLMWSYIVPWMGVVSMVNTLTAQSLGRGKLADCAAYAWQGLVGPAGLPEDVVKKLAGDLDAVLNNAEIVAKITGMGVEPMPMSPEAFREYAEKERAARLADSRAASALSSAIQAAERAKQEEAEKRTEAYHQRLADDLKIAAENGIVDAHNKQQNWMSSW